MTKSVSVKAASDGTAYVPLTLDGPDTNRVTASSHSANGWTSDDADWSVTFDTTPTVSSSVYPENGSGGRAGIPGTFTFTPKVKGIMSYTYNFGSGDRTVAARGNGTAQVSWPPSQSGPAFLDVHGTTKDGVLNCFVFRPQT